MSRNKHKQKQVQQKQPIAQNAPPPAPGIPSHAPTQSETDKAQDRRINSTFWLAAVSLVVSVASAFFAYRSASESAEANAIARAAQDRAVGRVQAKFEFVEEKNRDPNRDKPFMRKKDGYDQMVFRIETVDELSQWTPHVRIKNTGTEPIDALKTEVEYRYGMVYGPGVRQIEPAPIVYNDVLSHDGLLPKIGSRWYESLNGP